MNHLVINGIDFSGELPGEWTVGELVRVLETEVLFGDEVIVQVTVDGAPFGSGPEEGGPSLDVVDRVTVESRKVDEVLLSAIGSAGSSLERFLEQTTDAAEDLRIGREQSGWHHHHSALVTLQLFVDLCDRLGTTMRGGLGPGPAKGAQLHGIAREIGERLGTVEVAAQGDDIVELCDGMEDLADWLRGEWDAVWCDAASDDAGYATEYKG